MDVSRKQVATEVKAAIVYVKDLDISPPEVPEDIPIFRRDDDDTRALDLDSLDALELGILFEEKYGMGIGSELELSRETTLADVISFLVNYLSIDRPAVQA